MKRRKRRKNQSMINYRLERRTKIGNPEERRKERMLENAIPIGEREKKKGKKKKKKRHRGQKGKVIVGMKERKKKERRLELVTITSVIEFDRHPFPLSLSLSLSLARSRQSMEAAIGQRFNGDIGYPCLFSLYFQLPLPTRRVTFLSPHTGGGCSPWQRRGARS